jgi:hypothetical protein
MKTIYLDHNIVRYFIKGFPKQFDMGIEHAALVQASALRPDVRFVVSDWNVVEAARECARQAVPRLLADRYASFFEGIDPLFIDGHDTLERAEMAAFAFAHWNKPNAAHSASYVFASHFSQIASARVKDMLVGFDLRKYLSHLATTPSSLAAFNPSVSTARTALKTNISAYNDGRLFDAETEKQTLRSWFSSLVPERDRDGKWIDASLRDELVSSLSAAPEGLFRSCPAVRIEGILSELRAAGGGRIPKDSDGFDLMHAVPALAYCDAFVSADAYLREQANKARVESPSAIVVEDRLSEAMRQL